MNDTPEDRLGLICTKHRVLTHEINQITDEADRNEALKLHGEIEAARLAVRELRSKVKNLASNTGKWARYREDRAANKSIRQQRYHDAQCERVRQAMFVARGVKAKAMRELGMATSTFQKWLKIVRELDEANPTTPPRCPLCGQIEPSHDIPKQP